MTVHVCPPDHGHDQAGTCYHEHKCRCAPCVARSNAYERHRARLIAYGRWQPYVPATRARNHLRVLSAAGIGYRHASRLSGLASAALREIRTGITTQIRPVTEQRILAIAVTTERAAGTHIPSRGTQRRLQALHARGWSTTALAPHLGMLHGNIARLHQQRQVSLRVHQAVSDVYDRLWNAAPTNSQRSQQQTRARAMSQGWVPPLAWDDIDDDDEPASGEVVIVDEIAVDLATHGHQVHLTREERLIVVEALNRRGYNDQEIAAMTRVTDKTITRDRDELGLAANLGPAEERLAA